MDPEFGTRLIMAVMITGVGLILFNLVNKYNLARNHGKITRHPGYRPGVPAILYFTTPTCVPCKTVQRPALKKLKDVLGERIQILEVDASSNEDLVSTWGVLSVPTTYIFDDEGNPRHVNHGVAMTEKLFQQLEIEDYSI